MPATELTVRVEKKFHLTNEIVSYELVGLTENLLPDFTAGSHIDVFLKNGLIRQYSLYKKSSENIRYCIAVLRTKDSKGGSSAMHDWVNEGDELTISSPKNHFQLDESAPSTMLLAGGIGITPLLCMADRLFELNKYFQLHYFAKSKEHMAFLQYLCETQYNKNVHFYFSEDIDNQYSLEGIMGTISRDSQLYVCGPPGFMEMIITSASTTLSEDKIHREYFVSNLQINIDQEQEFRIQLASTGKEYTIPQNKTIVEVLRDQGIDVMVSCEQGVCGTCITRVIEGIPLHRDIFMSNHEHDANNQITLCCSRSKSKLLVLDI